MLTSNFPKKSPAIFFLINAFCAFVKDEPERSIDVAQRKFDVVLVFFFTSLNFLRTMRRETSSSIKGSKWTGFRFSRLDERAGEGVTKAPDLVFLFVFRFGVDGGRRFKGRLGIAF